MTFHVGQRVLLIADAGGRHSWTIGLTATIESTPTVEDAFYTITIDSDERRGMWAAIEPEMKPLGDDSREVTTWEAIRKLTGYVPGESVHG